MSKFSNLIRKMKDRLFGSEHVHPDIDKEPSKPPEPVPATPWTGERERPHFIQIGFDFGTSFSKCICRDVMTDKAWVHISPVFSNQELPFLIPSVFLFRGGRFYDVEDQDSQYPEDGLYHLKTALVKVALDEVNDPVLEPYRRVLKDSGAHQLRGFVESCAVFFLARALGTVRHQVKERLPDFCEHPKDYMAVNLAVPVGDVERTEVNHLYQRVLHEAWALADQLYGHSAIALEELNDLRRENPVAKDPSIGQACFIYPEVSANVQGFVRSRVSSSGMYLFSDTGAATVDQSVFIYFRKPDNTEHLTYLHGNVLPCGSSRIELEAARTSGRVDHQALEMWRKKKENGDANTKLVEARNALVQPLVAGTKSTLASAKHKLFVREQLNEIRVIFGGGGHCEHPYRSSVLNPFSGNLFRRPVQPAVVGLPVPNDLGLSESQRRWMGRLAVAYGLSFWRDDLTGFTYPRDVEPPEPAQLWSTERVLPSYVSKDQC
jgi:hypothetical protein